MFHMSRAVFDVLWPRIHETLPSAFRATGAVETPSQGGDGIDADQGVGSQAAPTKRWWRGCDQPSWAAARILPRPRRRLYPRPVRGPNSSRGARGRRSATAIMGRRRENRGKCMFRRGLSTPCCLILVRKVPCAHEIQNVLGLLLYPDTRPQNI